VVGGGVGNDRIVTSRGADRVTGGPGQDVIATRAGNDTIDAVDGERDVVNCGAGRDTVKADPIDVLRGCEHVQRVPTR
jgi:Ca2+-binding RTX toxin-like protein